MTSSPGCPPSTAAKAPAATLYAASFDAGLISGVNSHLSLPPTAHSLEPNLFTPASYGRYLVARNDDVNKAAELLQFTHNWRARTGITTMTFSSHLALIKSEGHTGKIYFAGSDCHGRPVIVFDNSCQNTKSREKQMLFLAYFFDLAIKQMAIYNASTVPPPTPIAKWVIFMNMSR